MTCGADIDSPGLPGGPGMPLEPGSPWSPFSPLGPTGPAIPGFPCLPGGPIIPCRPCFPRGPLLPRDPFTPLTPGLPGGPEGQTFSVDLQYFVGMSCSKCLVISLRTSSIVMTLGKLAGAFLRFLRNMIGMSGRFC